MFNAEEARTRLLHIENEREKQIDHLLSLDDRTLTQTIKNKLSTRHPENDAFWRLALEPALIHRVHNILRDMMRVNQRLLETRKDPEWDEWRTGAKIFQANVAQRRSPLTAAVKELNRAQNEAEASRDVGRLSSVLRQLTLAAREAGVLVEERATLRHPRSGLTLDEMFDTGAWS